MNLNKNKKKYHKLTYDGDKVIKKGTKEFYPFVYKRTWDLTKYNVVILEKYGLKKAMYIYIGSSNKYNLIDRCSQWKNQILSNRKSVSKDIRYFIENLKNFYKIETDYTAKEIDYLLYYNANVIARCENLQGARRLEKHFTTKYHYLDFTGEILEQHTILLSKVDSNLRNVVDGKIKILKERISA